MLECAFCELPAVSGVNSVELDEYYGVCADDLARLVSEFEMIAVELVTEFAPCECGCDY